MKKQIIAVGVALFTVAAFGQKKEIKKAERAAEKEDYQEAMTYLQEAEPLLASADNELKAQFYITQGEVYAATAGNDMAKLQMAAEAFKKGREFDTEGEFKDRMDSGLGNIKASLEEDALADYNAQKYKDASSKFYVAYQLSPVDTLYLMNAALAAGNAKMTDKALKYYTELVDIGYTGKVAEFVATNNETKEVEVFNSANERDLYIKAGTHSNPSKRISASKQDDILRNLTSIYMEKGEDEKAVELISELRKANPDDMALVRAEADLVYRMGNLKKYNELMGEIIKSDPNNPEVYFNLGVGSAELGDNEKAIEYYKKAVQADENYARAYINLGALILSRETALVEEMNNLGTSRADNARYDKLKQQRIELYNEAAPYLEKASELRPENVELVRTLMNIYGQTGKDAKFKEMKAKLAEMEGGQ